MASPQNTYPCPLWGRDVGDLVQSGVDPETHATYRFINRSSFDLLSPLILPMAPEALLIRNTYENLYDLLSESSLPTRPGSVYTGFTVIGQPGIGRLQLHCVSPEDCLMVIFRQVAVSGICTPSPPMRKEAHCLSIRIGHHMDF
jgi:hypothetical protein